MGADNFSLYDTHQDDPELESAARARLLLARLDGSITADEFTLFAQMCGLFQNEDDTRTGAARGTERRATARRHQSKGSGPHA